MVLLSSLEAQGLAAMSKEEGSPYPQRGLTFQSAAQVTPSPETLYSSESSLHRPLVVGGETFVFMVCGMQK